MVADARFEMLQPLRAAISTALYPLQWLVLQPLSLSQHFQGRLADMSTSEAQVRQLRDQLAEQRQRAQQTEQLNLENRRLRGILSLPEREIPGTVVAQVVYDAADPYTRKVVLDKGENQGVHVASPVIDELGVIGQVTRVFPLTSEVTLITDRDHAIPVVNARTGARGVAFGENTRNADALELRFMAANADVSAGDLLTTSGVDGVYPAGLPVARVNKVERRTEAVFARIECLPIAMVAGTHHVLVLLPTAQAVPRPPAEPEHKVFKSGGRR